MDPRQLEPDGGVRQERRRRWKKKTKRVGQEHKEDGEGDELEDEMGERENIWRQMKKKEVMT